MAEHRAIVTALRDRIPDVVRATVTTHIFGVEHWLRSATPEIRRRVLPDEASVGTRIPG
jgi:DNA-binding FadR family transcriptional regulator